MALPPWPRSRVVEDPVMRPGPYRWGLCAPERRSARLGADVAEPLEHARLQGTGWRRAGLVILELDDDRRRQGRIGLEGLL